ncbi:unnamed protein product [Brassicogethes aeneus]|uniref:Uncharacterized protein n=1 Tax=Brassicogethes aeneus TaxID=1431903 RepID=A0A9P0FFY3_BRAAE|nr:unnamed protein product [Brassicogethes aeneus]
MRDSGDLDSESEPFSSGSSDNFEPSVSESEGSANEAGPAIRLGTFHRRVCKKAFCAMHGVSGKRVERLGSYIAVNTTTTAPPDSRGKHRNRPNLIPQELVLQVDSQKFSTQEISLQYFKANFNISFGHPRSDTCQVCDRIDIQLKGRATLSEDEIKKIETEKNLHQTKAEVFFKDMREKSDHEQNAPLPKIPSEKVKLYNKPLPLKKAKYDNVMHLAEKYVPKADIGYYNSLVSDEIMNEETDDTEDDENDAE